MELQVDGKGSSGHAVDGWKKEVGEMSTDRNPPRPPRGSGPPINSALLPASFRNDDHKIVLPSADTEEFLQRLAIELSVERIDNVVPLLSIVGRPYPPRPLNTQRVLDRDIIPCNDTSLHLVWTTRKVYIRPLPACLRCLTFFENHLSRNKLTHVTRPALGLLYSYITLVPTELDFEIAQNANLLPRGYEWHKWKDLVHRVLSDYSGVSDMVTELELPKRYRYGELRLSRLDKIYRYTRGEWLHGYSRLTGSTRYVDFFGENIAVIGASTVYLVVIVSAMQLGRTTTELKGNEAFDRACYGFAVFAIFLPIIAIALIVAVFLFRFTANGIRTIMVQKKRRPGEDVQSQPHKHSSTPEV